MEFTATGTAPPAIQSFTLTVIKQDQTIVFAPASPVLFTASPLSLTATASSGLAVSFSTPTPAVCAVAGTTVTLLATGTCTVAADQPGDTFYNPAPTVSRDILVNPDVPGAPVIGTAVSGNAQATISFTAPASNGGSPITLYTASCNTTPPGTAITGTGTASPIVVGGLANGTPYLCSVSATNAVGSGAASGTVGVTPVAPTPFALLGVVSRKTHGASGAFDIVIDLAQAIGGAITVETRAIGAGHTIVFHFNGPVSAAGTASCIDAAMAPVGTASAAISGNDVVVTLTGVPDNQRVTISLAGVSGNASGAAAPGVQAKLASAQTIASVGAAVGFLVGDVNNSRSATATDILQVKGRSGLLVDATNFQYDLNLSGAVTASDILAVKGRSGIALP
jgi:hypothetical protein